MNSSDEEDWKVKQMRSRFDASLPDRLRRAAAVQLQQLIPAHWFAAAASECAGMYIAGFFYGTISVAQAYLEALSKYLAEHHHVRIGKDTGERCRQLYNKGIISEGALQAALSILDDRNDFHHLNKEVEQDFQKLAVRAKHCINHMHTLESEVFAFSYSDENPGTVVLERSDYWPSEGPTLTQAHIRSLW